MTNPLDLLIVVAREIQRAANDSAAGEGGYRISARLLGKLDAALADIDTAHLLLTDDAKTI